MIHELKMDVRDWYERHRRNDTTAPVVWTLYLVLILMAILLILLPFDDVQVEGRYRLIKPLNFTGSFAVYLAVVVILLDYLRVSVRWKKFISWGISICILTAITCITMQAARGTTSHFNKDTPFDSTVSLLMDIADPVNSVFVFILLIFALRSKLDVSPPVQLGFVFGLGLFLAGGIIGGVMVFSGQNVVGVEPGGPGLPVVNWSTMGGRSQGRALPGYPRNSDFTDSGLANRPTGRFRKDDASEADTSCCRLRRIRFAHGPGVHAGLECYTVPANMNSEGSYSLRS